MEQTDWGWTWDALGALKRSKYDPLGPKSGQESGKTDENGRFLVFLRPRNGPNLLPNGQERLEFNPGYLYTAYRLQFGLLFRHRKNESVFCFEMVQNDLKMVQNDLEMDWT